MVFKSIIGAICLAVVSFNVNAIPTYDYNGDGEITGISGLEVYGVVWDMTLHDTSFSHLYTDSGGSAVYQDYFAQMATNSLISFTNTQPDINTSIYTGCTNVNSCTVMTAYYFNGSTVVGYGDRILASGGDSFRVDSEYGTINLAATTYATWKEASVPEPSISILMASGLIAFGVVRRKSRA